jgi:hypothetical protein
MTVHPGCPFCEGPGGRVVFEGAKLRVIHAEEAGFPAFYRVIWRDHAAGVFRSRAVEAHEDQPRVRTACCAWKR